MWQKGLITDSELQVIETIMRQKYHPEKKQDKDLINLPVLVVDDDRTCCESTVATLKEIGIMGG